MFFSQVPVACYCPTESDKQAMAAAAAKAIDCFLYRSQYSKVFTFKPRCADAPYKEHDRPLLQKTPTHVAEAVAKNQALAQARHVPKKDSDAPPPGLLGLDSSPSYPGLLGPDSSPSYPGVSKRFALQGESPSLLHSHVLPAEKQVDVIGKSPWSVGEGWGLATGGLQVDTSVLSPRELFAHQPAPMLAGDVPSAYVGHGTTNGATPMLSPRESLAVHPSLALIEGLQHLSVNSPDTEEPTETASATHNAVTVRSLPSKISTGTEKDTSSLDKTTDSVEATVSSLGQTSSKRGSPFDVCVQEHNSLLVFLQT